MVLWHSHPSAGVSNFSEEIAAGWHPVLVLASMLPCCSCQASMPQPCSYIAGHWAVFVWFLSNVLIMICTLPPPRPAVPAVQDHEVLVSRLIDRPIRPMIQSGWTHSTQVGSGASTLGACCSCAAHVPCCLLPGRRQSWLHHRHCHLRCCCSTRTAAASRPPPPQVLTWVLSYDGKHSPEPLAITAAGAALAISGEPCLISS